MLNFIKKSIKKGIISIGIISFVIININNCDNNLPTNEDTSVIYVKSGYVGQQKGTRSMPYSTITAAVNAAKENSTIMVLPGEYVEKEIKLKKGQKVISESPYEAVVSFPDNNYDIFQLKNCDNCEVRNFKIIGNSYRALKSSITCENSKDIKIINNYIDGPGIYVLLCSGLVKGNKIRDIGGIGAYPMAGNYELIVEDNEIYNYSIGDYKFSSMGIGGPKNSGRAIIRNNKITNCVRGIAITTDSNVILENNIVKDCEEWALILLGYSIHPWTMIDLGGGPANGKGGNIFSHKGSSSWDFINRSKMKVYAKFNKWTHNNANQIDRYDIKDDDEGEGGEVIFQPFIY